MTTAHTSATKTPGSRSRGGVLAVFAGAALVTAAGVGSIAFTATSAAFAGQTDSGINTFDAASVELDDDDGGVAMFQAPELLPGGSVTACLEVTYTGTTTDLSALRVHATSGGGLAPQLLLDIEHGAAGTTCAAIGATTSIHQGTLGDLGDDFATGATGPTPTATGESVPYLFTVTLDPNTPNSAQGQTATASFTWEVRSA